MESYIPKGGVLYDYLKDEKKYIRFRVIDGDYHSLIVGATRSGKTRCFVLPSIGAIGLSRESMILNDPKGELYEYTSDYLKALGYRVIALDFKNQKLSQKYNILNPIIKAIDENDIAKAVDKTWDVCNMLVPKNGHGEKIWTNGEMSIIASAIMSVVYDNRHGDRKKYQNMTNVYYFIATMCREKTTPRGESYFPLSNYIDELIKTEPNHPSLGLADISLIAPDRMRASFYGSALTTLQLYTNIGIYNITNDSDFDIEEFGLKPTALFIILPDEKETYYSISSIIVDQIYVELVALADRLGGRLPVRVNFLLDEFGNFTKIPSFNSKMTAGAGRGLRINMFLQSFMQLEEKYGKESAKIIIGNCEHIIYLRSTDMATLEELSKLMGQYTTRSHSTSGSVRYNSSSSSYSFNLMGRNLLTPDEIMRIQRPDTLILSSKHPVITHCPDISKTIFNDFFGMGDVEHNIKLRQERFNRRPEYFFEEINYWKVADKYIFQ